MTYALVLANCVIYALYELPYWQAGGEGAGPFGFFPADPTVGALLRSMFSHAGFMHLAGNMLYLWLFGSVVEDVLGPVLFLGFYFGGQMGATLLDVGIAKAYAPASLSIPRVGASGAIAAILGLAMVCFPRVRVRVLYLFGYFLVWRAGVARIQAWLFLGVWLVWQLGWGIIATSTAVATGQSMGGVGYWAHIGGFAAGMIGAWVLALPGRIRRHDLLSGQSQGEENTYAADADLRQLVRDTPDDAQAWLALGRSKEALGFASEALEAYARAAALFLQQHQPERAARTYAAVAHYDPSFSFPPAQQFDIAAALAHVGEYRLALAALDNLLRAYPNSAEAEVALLRAGELAAKTGAREAAVAYFDRLLRGYPYSAWRDYARQKLHDLEQ